MDIEGATKTKTKTPATQAPRSRLLLSCGRSAQAVARGAYRRVEAMRCPVGCVARGLSRAAAPLLGPLQLRCLAALAFADRQLAVAQDVATVLLPCSEPAFRKVDDLVLLVESLPARLDAAIDGLEGLVAGVVGLVDPRRYCGRPDVFRDIRCECDEEEGAAAAAIEKRCEEATRKVERVEVVKVDGGGEIGDPAKAISVGTDHDEKAERAAVQGAYKKTEEQEASGEDAVATPAKRDGGERGHAGEVLKHGGGGAVEVGEGAETRTAEATQSAETAKAERKEAEGISSEREEAIPMAMGSKEDALLHLFDEAWQQKMA